MEFCLVFFGIVDLQYHSFEATPFPNQDLFEKLSVRFNSMLSMSFVVIYAIDEVDGYFQSLAEATHALETSEEYL